MKTTEDSIENPIRGEIFSVERLEEYAAYLASQLKVSEAPKTIHLLLPRMRENGKKLLASYRALTEAIHRKDSIPPAGEWLTDNFHIVEDQLREIQEDLPPSYYKELPKISLGELTGYPRIYAIALALIAHTDSRLEPDTIRRFVQAYQRVSPLGIGELWALAITLRLVLVENLRRVTTRIVSDNNKKVQANKFADQLFEAVGDKIKFHGLVKKLTVSYCRNIEDDSAFMAQVVKRLRDQEQELWPALEHLEKYLTQLSSSTEQVVHTIHQLQASHQVTVANVITSMRLLSSLNWRDFFESLSLVDRILEKDPIYKQMDFPTRDRYRHVIERIGKRTKASEIEVAEKAIYLAKDSQAKDSTDLKRSHVGYYLINRGLRILEKQFHYKTSVRIRNFTFSHPNLIYFGSLGFFSIVACILPLYYGVSHGATLPMILGIALLILIPCSDLASNLTNLVLTHTFRPKTLPKLDFSSGIPQSARTMVVIPCLISGDRVIHDLLEKIEIHYLGNSDPQIHFALLTDFADAPQESMDEDASNLEGVKDGIRQLNQKYADDRGDRFFLFHRRRKWNGSEKLWMGWERKRGKIHEFNRLLRKDKNTSFSVTTAPDDLLPTIRFVITLDADTQLPRDSARKMIGAMMHPLNQPRLDGALGRVVEGHGVLQPRIGISLESSNKSAFAKIFSGFTGIDPYTTAVSDVYQDIFHEGIYTGKGIYEIDAFEASLADRVPENSILSHDLFEGLFSRAALLTDVELLDDYPQTYRSFFIRQHRWTRGDWQVGPWIFPFVRSGGGKWVRNRLPFISRWKIFDNLRRSLVAPALWCWFILAWASLPGSPLFWAAFALFIIIFPCLLQGLVEATARHTGKMSSRINSDGGKLRLNLLQAFLYFLFLGHQACVQMDAIARVIYRKLISKSRLLEWVTAAHVENQKTKLNLPLWQTWWPAEILIFATAGLFIRVHPKELIGALILVALWAACPFVDTWLSAERTRKKEFVSVDDEFLLRQIARRTWQYFETFVCSEDNWLPPDNYQEIPKPLTAHRTSPTNIGLYALSILSARDLGYITTSKFMTRLSGTLATMKKLEQYEGHYFNWYDTKTLQALVPKYVSTVDSGNLAAYLLTLRQACLDVAGWPVINTKIPDGLTDILFIVEAEVRAAGPSSTDMLVKFEKCRRQLVAPGKNTFSEWFSFFEKGQRSLEEIRTVVSRSGSQNTERGPAQWIESGISEIQEALEEAAVFAPWAQPKFLNLADRLAKQNILESIDGNIPLGDLPTLYDGAIEQVQTLKNTVSESSDLVQELEQFIEGLNKAKEAANCLLLEAAAAAQFMDEKFKEMNFAFLEDKSREIFSIGYSVTDKKIDGGFYDLLASESRLASFVAIAKGDLPQEHWFRLGRQLVPSAGSRALISWSASMFEYLMPVLVLRHFENTLLNETIHAVVARQIKYGSEHHVPWGVSESAYNARDLQLNYQYGPFGIPGLGLKRGLSHDLVISPYSTLLAAMIRPQAAVENLKLLVSAKLLTDYGFYESVDYTAERLPEHQKFAVVKSFMAHHQGMSLVAVNNVINGNIIQNRFHCDPRVRATQLLLQERIPRGTVPILPKAAEIELEGEHRAVANTFIRHFSDPNSPTPRLQLLSNRNYSIMISTAGGGYSKCGDLAVTRWREDVTRDNWGSFIFVRNLTQDALWSTSYQPFAVLPSFYKVTFGEDKVEFRRRDGDISTHTQILVAPEDNVEIRHVTLANHSLRPQTLELTSYLEPVLAPLASDLNHMAFSKLFIQTEFLSSKNALLAKRRKRISQDPENWGLHVVVSDGQILTDVQYETDRARFIGRGRDLPDAVALGKGVNLSNSSGATLDPILSLRVRVKVPANGKIQVAFTTGLTPSREKALELADRYHDIHAFERESKIAWTKSQVDMRHLNIDTEAAYMYQRLADRVLYSEPSLRAPSHQRAEKTNVQATLWPSGISGDLPIVVVRISDAKDMAVVRKLLRCHEYLRLKGLIYDFIILNENPATYLMSLQDELQQQIRSTGSQGWINRPGGIFILRTDITPEKDIDHILSVARVSISADESLKDQLNRKPLEEKYPPVQWFPLKKKMERAPAVPLPVLDFFNGIGGFSPDGKEYVIILRPDRWPPAPWINVIGNKENFGFQISETGSGFTWSQNSQTNRLTPWSNDPVADPSGEIIYLRDNDTGEIWAPTPLPVRSDAVYTVRHGQGYSIFEHARGGLDHSLTVFVPKEDSVKITILKLKNGSGRKRRFSLTHYTEWVLGSQRENTSPYLICNIDNESGAAFARNPHDNEFASRVAFSAINADNVTFTCHRTEFLGRHGSYGAPAALKREGLSKKPSAGQDPCSVLQTSFIMEAGEGREFIILLGQGENSAAARQLVSRYKNHDTVKAALNEALQSWENINNSIQVKTPDPAMNILMNRWLLYQTLSCRHWSRTAFYQSGGAYGFRDQLQDCMAFVYAAPELTKEHILRAAARQFIEGDVQHWWHPPGGRGIRTRMSDDLLWLPFVVSFYINVTGDKSILTEKCSFLEAPLLKPEEEDSFTLPRVSSQSGTILEHCIRAIDRSLTSGAHGLPLMGTGDWNDGMNRVGRLGKGESVWLGWFLYKVIADFLPFCVAPEGNQTREKYESYMQKLKVALEDGAWDGEWYKRAYFDDGTPLGSNTNDECKIDSIAQSWAVFSGGADRTRAGRAMEKVAELLVHKASQLILLFTPPFDKGSQDPGYIKGYVPGVRENGGQYTHGAIWVMMAFAELGDGNKAYELYNMLNPILHSQTGMEKYKIEPYVIAGDVYSGSSIEGRGGWSWYTGSASWSYRGALESLLGFHLRGDKLTIVPCIPSAWSGYEISYTRGKSKYLVRVQNPKGLTGGKTKVELDGKLLPDSEILLVDDGKIHEISVTLQVSQPETPARPLYNDQSRL